MHNTAPPILNGTLQSRAQLDPVDGAVPLPASTAAVTARIGRLEALVHQIEEPVVAEVVSDYAPVAQIARIARARLSPVLALLNVAPDLLEQLRGKPRPEKGHARTSSKGGG